MQQRQPRRQRVTAEMLPALSDDGRPRELVHGKVVAVAPAGVVDALLAQRLAANIGLHVTAFSLGQTYTAGTGFILKRQPDTVRVPAMAFIAQPRVPDTPAAGPIGVVPDLVIEVVSPADSVANVLAKVGDWLEAGVAVVWVFWAAEQRVTVYRSGTDIGVLDSDDALFCEDLLPGLAVPLGELFG